MDVASLKKFYMRFPSEEICLDYIEELRWPDVRTCPHCGSTKTYKFKSGKLFKCAGCKKQFTVKIGTIFTDSHVQIQDWLLSIALLTAGDQGISTTRLAEYLEVTQKTAWFILHRIRYALEYDADSPVGRKRTETYTVDLTFDQAMDKLIRVVLPDDFR